MVSTQEAIAIAEICVYIPIFLLTIIVVLRHGFQKQLGWIYLAIFSIVRIAGAGFEIAKVHSPTNKTDIEWSAILQGVGLSPLLMASLGLLKRVTDSVSNHIPSGGMSLPNRGIFKIIVKHATANSRRSRILQMAQLLSLIALILSVTGGLDAADSDPSERADGKKNTRIGVMMFLAVYLALGAISIITMKDFRRADKSEKRVFLAVLAALPLLAVRILYSILSAFSNNSVFSILNGNAVVRLFMAIIEEFLIVFFYTIAGLVASK